MKILKELFKIAKDARDDAMSDIVRDRLNIAEGTRTNPEALVNPEQFFGFKKKNKDKNEKDVIIGQPEIKQRRGWDSIWMQFADIISQRSIDDRRKVGAVIVTSDNAQVLSLGYNGDQRGGPNVVESNEPGKSGCVHAEINSLIKLDYNNQKKRIMYVTTFPCNDCSKCIVNARIDEVVYRDDYRNSDGLKILLDAGIAVRKHPVN